jgi:hypothetical protein
MPAPVGDPGRPPAFYRAALHEGGGRTETVDGGRRDRDGHNIEAICHLRDRVA